MVYWISHDASADETLLSFHCYLNQLVALRQPRYANPCNTGWSSSPAQKLHSLPNHRIGSMLRHGPTWWYSHALRGNTHMPTRCWGLYFIMVKYTPVMVEFISLPYPHYISSYDEKSEHWFWSVLQFHVACRKYIGKIAASVNHTVFS